MLKDPAEVYCGFCDELVPALVERDSEHDRHYKCEQCHSREVYTDLRDCDKCGMERPKETGSMRGFRGMQKFYCLNCLIEHQVCG